MSFYEVKVVNRSGAVLATFNADSGDGDIREKVTVDEVTWALNEPGSATISAPLHHPATAQILGLRREIQVWRDGSIIFWGVPLQGDAPEGSQRMTWVCPGLLWYFTRLHFGPVTINYLTNPLFATNLTGWTAVGCTATHSTALRIRGPGTARLVSTSYGDNYLQQQFVIPSTTNIGLFLDLAGWYWLDPAVAHDDTAFGERGLYIDSPNSNGPVWEPITMNSPIGVMERLEIGIHLLPLLTNETVTVRLYSPDAAIHWGALSVTELQSVSGDLITGTDITDMMRQAVVYAQTKFPLNIGTSTPASGVVERTAYQFADLGVIFAMLESYPARNLADFEVVITPTTRTFTTYAPRKGTLKSGSALTVPGSSVLKMGYRIDGQETATRVICRGAGSGSDREIGEATDAAGLDGLILERITDAPPELAIDSLNDYAAADLARMKNLVTLPELTVPAAGWVGVVGLGDTVPVTIDWGAVQDTSTKRVVAMTLDPKTDTVRVGFNVA